MSDTQENISTQGNNINSENMLNRAAHSIGYFWGSTRLRLQDVTKAIQEKGGSIDMPGIKKQGSASSEQEQQQNPSATERTDGSESQDQGAINKAEEIIDNLGLRIGFIAGGVSLFVRKTAARVREDVEDVWAESQNIARHKDRQPSSKE
jgi:hypothetical protein